VDRHSAVGYCGVKGEEIYCARAALHYWEEPCISGDKGSGTVFFSGCNLRCVYCQNFGVSRGKVGKPISVERLSDIFIEQQERGAENINLVTPTHYSLRIAEAVRLAVDKGLRLPVVYNCSGYESVDTLRAIADTVDIYLTDFKYSDNTIAKSYSDAGDYFEVASAALEEMVRQQGEPIFDSRGIMQRGVIVRNLLLPGCLDNSKEVVKYVHNRYGNRVYISLMSQYTPLEYVKSYPELNRKVSEAEYNELVDYAIELGVENGFIQEGETAEESFIPSFECEGV
jgi:putative pyruvate formate lyase activating enzyme